MVSYNNMIIYIPFSCKIKIKMVQVKWFYLSPKCNIFLVPGSNLLFDEKLKPLSILVYCPNWILQFIVCLSAVFNSIHICGYVRLLSLLRHLRISWFCLILPSFVDQKVYRICWTFKCCFRMRTVGRGQLFWEVHFLATINDTIELSVLVLSFLGLFQWVFSEQRVIMFNTLSVLPGVWETSSLIMFSIYIQF